MGSPPPKTAPRPVVSTAPPADVNNATTIDGPRAFAGRFLANGPTEDTACGTVMPATDLQTGAAVRLVLVSEAALPSAALAERALREWKQLAKVSTAKILKVIDQGRLDDGKVYVASEPPRGRSLSEVVAQNGPLSVERVKRIVAQVGEALTEAQKVGVIHRDVSPQNVYVSGDADDVAVGEFGLAEAVTESVFGSPAYLSPEQAEGKPVDQRSNIYSLGAVVYFMLTGKAPFEGDAQSLLAQHVAATPVAPSVKRAGLPAELDRIVMKALEKGGGRRHLTLRQFITEVEAVPLGSSSVRSVDLGSAATLTPPEAGAATVVGMSAPSPEALAAARAPSAAVPTATAGPSAKTASAPAPTAKPAAATAMGVPAVSAATEPSPVFNAPVAEAAVAAPAATAPAAAAPTPVVTPKPGAVQSKKPAAGGFRETAWFKKGEIEEELAKAQAAAATEDPLAPAGTTGVHTAVDEASIDVTSQDAKRLSLKTGATQMMSAIKVGTDGQPALPGERMDEAEMIAEIDQSRRWFTIAGAVVLVAVVALIVALVARRGGDTSTTKPAPKAAATSPPAPTTTAAAPPAEPNRGQAGAAAPVQAKKTDAPVGDRAKVEPEKKAEATAKPAVSDALAEAEAALGKGDLAATVDALHRAAQGGAPSDKVANLARNAQKAAALSVIKAKKKKDRAGEAAAKTLLAKLKPFIPAAAPKAAAGKQGAAARRKR